jgi:hypothetical protein
MTNFAKQLVVGQKVFVVQYYSWGNDSYTSGVVSKITPSGFIDVLIGCSASPKRFYCVGKERGEYSNRYLDDMPYEDRKVDIARREKLSEANNALSKIASEKMRNPEKIDLVKELARLRSILDSVQALVEVIQ